MAHFAKHHGEGGGGGGLKTNKVNVTSKYTLLEKSATWNPFCPVFRTLGGKGSQKGSLHV